MYIYFVLLETRNLKYYKLLSNLSGRGHNLPDSDNVISVTSK